jgi:glc operon protein GlcG
LKSHLSRWPVCWAQASATPKECKEVVILAGVSWKIILLLYQVATQEFLMSIHSFYAFILAALAVSSALAADAPLILRGRIDLQLEGAERALAAAKAKAAELGTKSNIAIVDDGGHLISFARMDGARPASGSTALTKAVSAATFRQETGTLPANGEADLHLSLGIEQAASASGGKITTLKGGVPIVVDGQVIGAIGVGGGTGEQDVQVAKAGVKALLDAIKDN